MHQIRRTIRGLKRENVLLCNIIVNHKNIQILNKNSFNINNNKQNPILTNIIKNFVGIPTSPTTIIPISLMTADKQIIQTIKASQINIFLTTPLIIPINPRRMFKKNMNKNHKSPHYFFIILSFIKIITIIIIITI